MPTVAIALSCIEGCGLRVHVLVGLPLDDLTAALWTRRWMLSIVGVGDNDPGEITMGPLCPACAERVCPRETLTETRRLLAAKYGERPS